MDIFQQRTDENAKILNGIDTFDSKMSDKDYVQLCVNQVMDLLEKERGKHSTKRVNLGDTISTKIETSVII
jgi:hypothetical protein